MDTDVAVHDKLTRVLRLKATLDRLCTDLRRTEAQFLEAVSDLYDARTRRAQTGE